MKQKRSVLAEPAFAILLVAGISALSFLPLAGGLGFYRDDWHLIWTGLTQGWQEIIVEFSIDRPFMGVLYALTYRLLGEAPIAWVLYAFAVRLAGGFAFYWILRKLLPGKGAAVTAMTLLFMVYPGYLQQGNANTFQNQFWTLSLSLVSIAMNLAAVETPSLWRRTLFGAGATLAALGYMVIYEYMIGLEGLRLAVLYLWQDRGRTEYHLKMSVRDLLFSASPGIISAVIFLTWRLVFFRSARSATDFGALAARYRSEPVQMGFGLAVEVFKDLWDSIYSAWSVPFYNFLSNASLKDLALSFGIALAGCVLAWMYFRKYEGTPENRGDGWEKIIWAGAFCVLVALVPIAFSGRQILFRDAIDRYTLSTTPGVALILAGLAWKFLERKPRLALLGVLLCVSLVTQYGAAAFYRDAWDVQRQAWWQFSWRVPDLKDQSTVVMFLPDPYRQWEGYEVWAPLNLIYRSQPGPLMLSGETLIPENLARLMRAETYGKTMRKIEYVVDYKNSLTASLPKKGACLHILDGETGALSSEEDALVRLAHPTSRISLVEAASSGHQPPARIFGREPEHGWCYYYQKGNLAAQLGDWQEVVRLGDEAASRGLEPSDSFEWLPFYEGYARQGRMDEANRIGGVIRSDALLSWSYCREYQASQSLIQLAGKIDRFLVQNLCPEISME